jgi:type II restriction enzyme
MKINRENNNAWIINKHINNVNLLIVYAKILKENNGLNESKVREFTEYLKDTGLYNPRWSDREINITTALNKVSELCFYMFGYKNSENNKFIFSPLGNLFLEQENNSKSKMFVFISMLWSIQFTHPHNNTQDKFNLYPFRLILKLLTDSRLKFKIYSAEILYFLYFIEEIDDKSYESLINQIINYRTLSKDEKIKLFFEAPMGTQINIEKWGYKKATETWWANKTHEWDYYFRKVLEQINIISSHNNDDPLINLQQGKTNTFRTLNNNYIQLNPDLIDFIDELNKEYPFTETPTQKEGILESEFKADVYSFFPGCLMNYIDVKPKKYKQLLVVNQILIKSIKQVKAEINTYSVQGENHREFEFALRDGFNSFKDIKAERVGGAGKTDVECVYTNLNKSFAVEAKATKNSFGSLQLGRLKEHRNGINGMYTILMTPRYQPVVERDIINEEIVILKPAIFSEYIYNHLYEYEEISFKELHQIIEENKGKDISRLLSEVTFNRFGV